MKLIPRNDNVIIRQLEKAEVQAGIVRPQSALEDETEPVFGIIESVGEGIEPSLHPFNPGDLVFLRYIDGMRFHVGRATMILAKSFEICGIAELNDDDGYILNPSDEEEE